MAAPLPANRKQTDSGPLPTLQHDDDAADSTVKRSRLRYVLQRQVGLAELLLALALFGVCF